MDLQTTRQQLAELIDERNTCQAAVADAERKRQAAVQRRAQLRAQQALDGVDMSKRIVAAEQEIADSDTLISLWPDIEAELGQRIAVAEQAIKTAQVDVLVAELAALKEGEPGARLQFAQALHNLATVALAVNTDLQRKAALKTQLHKLGRAVDCGDCEMPMWNRLGIGHQSAVDETTALVALCQVG